MAKRGKTIQINLSNRLLYTFMAIGILLVVGVGVYAYTGSVGHTADQINEEDPTVAASVKDGVSWSEVSEIPSDIADGDDVGIALESDPTVNNYVKDKASCVAITGGAGLCDGVDNTGGIEIGADYNEGFPNNVGRYVAGNCLASERGKVEVRYNTALAGPSNGIDSLCYCGYFGAGYQWYCHGART